MSFELRHLNSLKVSQIVKFGHSFFSAENEKKAKIPSLTTISTRRIWHEPDIKLKFEHGVSTLVATGSNVESTVVNFFKILGRREEVITLPPTGSFDMKSLSKKFLKMISLLTFKCWCYRTWCNCWKRPHGGMYQ